MSVIGTLTAVISANTAPFEQGMKRSQAAMGGLQSSSAAASPDIMGMGLKLLGVASAAALAYKAVSIFSAHLDSMDQLGDTADNLGITADKLRVLQYAAEQSGSSAEGMNSALQTMEKNAVDSAMGLGRAQVAFKALGIDAAQLSQLSPDEMFRTLAESISRVQNPAERTQLAMKIFGDEGAKLSALLGQGAAGVDAFTQKAKEMGLLIGDTKAAQDASDAIKSMNAAWGAMVDRIVILVAPAITWIADKISLIAEGWNVIIDAFTGGGQAATKLATGVNQSTVALMAQAKAAEAAAAEVEKKREADQKAGESIFEATRTADEKFAKQEQDLRRLLGVGAINRDTFNRAMAKAQDDLEKSRPREPELKLETPRLGRTADRPGALSGSAAINQFLLNQTNTEGDPIERLLKQQHEEQIAKLEAIRAAAERGGVRVGVF